MGLEGVLTSAGWNGFGVAAMLLALAAFLAMTIHTLLRPKDEIEAAARLWMDDEVTRRPTASRGAQPHAER